MSLYFRQLLSGKDFAKSDPMASQMVNFTYAIGDLETSEALLIDPAYSVSELLATLESDGMRLTGVLATHYHFDHVGGTIQGFSVEGIAALLSKIDVPIHIQRDEVTWVERSTGVSRDHFVLHDGSDHVGVGEITVELVHTPGHTPGSQCFLVQKRLISGDTLFLDGCGRTDLPGSDPQAMYESLTQRLARVPDDAVVYPGHQYSKAPFQSMGDTRATNYVFRPRSAQEWLAAFGA